MSSKIFKKSIQMSILVEAEYLEYIKQLAIQMSAREKRVITPSEMFRKAVYERYPMPENSETTTSVED